MAGLYAPRMTSEMGRERPRLLGADLHHQRGKCAVIFESISADLRREPTALRRTGYVALEDHARARYLLALDGITCAPGAARYAIREPWSMRVGVCASQVLESPGESSGDQLPRAQAAQLLLVSAPSAPAPPCRSKTGAHRAGSIITTGWSRGCTSCRSGPPRPPTSSGCSRT